jgi:hypothetical protein
MEQIVRQRLGQKYISSKLILELFNTIKCEEALCLTIKDINNHKRFWFNGNRDSDRGYYNNIRIMKLFPELPVSIMHDYKKELNTYIPGEYWLEFHKGLVTLYDHKFNEIADFSGMGTVEILCELYKIVK